MKKIFAFLLAAAMAFGAFSFASAKTTETTREGVGMSIAGFSAHLLLSEEVIDSSSIADYDLTFINYWATWCGPCVSEMPHISQMYQHYQETPENDVQVIGAISVGGGCTEQTASAFLTNNHYDWPNVVPDSVLNSVFHASGYIPQTLIVDRNGVVRDHIVGSFSSYTEMLNYVETWLDAFQNHDDETCTVTFQSDIDDEILGTVEVPHGTLIPEPPAAPEVEGYLFQGYQYTDDNILVGGYPTEFYIAMGDCTVVAHYTIRRYLVRFYDSYNNSMLSSQQVNHGEAAVPPAEPNHEDVGLYFVGWDTDFSCITSQTYIYSVYRPVGDVNGDNQVTTSDALSALRMAMHLIELPEDITFADYNGDGSVDASDAILILRYAMGLLS